MKRLISLLIVMVMLCGCAPKSGESVPPSTAAVTPAATEPTETEPAETEPAATLLEHAEVWENDPQLVNIRLEILQQQWERVLFTDGRMILGRIEYNDQGTDYHLRMASVDLRTGEVTGRQLLPMKGYPALQIWNGTVAVCDGTGGSVQQWSKDLECLNQWETEPDDGFWYLGRREGRMVLYRFGSAAEDLVAQDLETGERTVVLGRHPELWNYGTTETELFTSCVEGPCHLLRPCSVDLLTGEIRVLPGTIPMYTTSRSADGVWLSGGAEGNRYYLTKGEKTWRVDTSFGTCTLLPEGRLMCIDLEGTGVSVYDTDGTILGSCRPLRQEDESWFMQLSWSECYGGYFLPVFCSDGRVALLLWKLGDAPRGENLVLTEAASEESVPAGTAVARELYDRAAQIGRTYGLEIRIADQCDLEDTSMHVEPLFDEEEISRGLTVLEEQLSQYPEGFFRQLRWGRIRRVQINLTDWIGRDAEYSIETSYAGYTDQRGDTCLIMMDVGMALDMTIAHEMSHVIDRKLAWDAQCREGMLFSEEAWASFNPEGFAYSYDYENVASYFEDRSMYAWFLSPYSMVNPTEDRAQVMEASMGIPWAFDEAPAMREKLAYYCECIRQDFDTTGWPEVTVWEEVLRE